MDGLSSRIRPVSLSYSGSGTIAVSTERQPRDNREMSEQQSGARVAREWLKYAAAFAMLFSIGIGNMWGVAITTADLNFGTPAISEDFESCTTSSFAGNTSSTTTRTDMADYGCFTHCYIGKTDESLFSIKNATGPMTSKHLQLETNTNTVGVGFTRSFASKGAFSFRIATSSKAYIGLYTSAPNNNAVNKSNTSVFLNFSGSAIQIHNGANTSNWVNAITTLPSTDIMDIAIVYNNTEEGTTYGDGITLSAKKAHIYVNGSAVMDGEAPKEFTIPGRSLTYFNITAGSGYTASQIDDIKIYDALPTDACTNKVTVTRGDASNGTYVLKAGSASGTTITTGNKVKNCDNDAVVVLIPSANTGYRTTTPTATNSTSITGPDGSGNYTITYTKGSNIASTITALFEAKPLESIALAQDAISVYYGEIKYVNVIYTPSDILTKGFSQVSTPSYCQIGTYASNMQAKITGGRAGNDTSIEQTETVSIKATADNSKTASITVTIKPLPVVHFKDLLHGETFDDVVSTVETGVVSHNKNTPTHPVDWSGESAISCETDHVHLVGWIDSAWADEHMADETLPNKDAINESGSFLAPGAAINTETLNGKTYYAVWSTVEDEK